MNAHGIKTHLSLPRSLAHFPIFQDAVENKATVVVDGGEGVEVEVTTSQFGMLKGNNERGWASRVRVWGSR